MSWCVGMRSEHALSVQHVAHSVGEGGVGVGVVRVVVVEGGDIE